MEVGDGFAAVGAVVDDDAEAVFGESFAMGNASGDLQKVAEEGGVFAGGEGDAGDGLAGDDEEVDGGLRGDVAEGDALVVFMDDVGGNLPGADFFKEGGFRHTWAGCHFSFLPASVLARPGGMWQGGAWIWRK